MVPFIYTSSARAAWFWISCGVWVAMEIWVWARERGGTVGENRDRGSRIQIVVSFWIGFWIAFQALYALPQAGFRRDRELLFLLGTGLIWTGVGLRFWAIRTLGKYFRTAVILQPGHEVIQRGPYRRLRNPSYTGALISLAGMGLALNNWVSLAALVVAALVAYVRRIRVEQQALLEHFGDSYRRYMAKSWALIPYVW